MLLELTSHFIRRLAGKEDLQTVVLYAVYYRYFADRLLGGLFGFGLFQLLNALFDASDVGVVLDSCQV